jgi:hypothetical protein
MVWILTSLVLRSGSLQVWNYHVLDSYKSGITTLWIFTSLELPRSGFLPVWTLTIPDLQNSGFLQLRIYNLVRCVAVCRLRKCSDKSMCGSTNQAAFHWLGCWTRTVSSSGRKVPLMLTQLLDKKSKERLPFSEQPR